MYIALNVAVNYVDMRQNSQVQSIDILWNYEGSYLIFQS